MEDVPRLEQTMRALEMRGPSGKGGSLRGECDAIAQCVGVDPGCPQTSREHKQPQALSRLAEEQVHDAARALTIDVNRRVKRVHVPPRGFRYRRRPKLCAHCVEPRLHLATRQFDTADRFRDADVQISTHEAGGPNGHHQPVTDRNQTVELERRMKRDEDRTDDAEEDVHLEPVLQCADR